MAVRLALLGHPGEDGTRPAGEPGRLEQGEGEPARGERSVVPAPEFATRGHAAHLVVELGPRRTPLPMAVADEGDEVGRG